MTIPHANASPAVDKTPMTQTTAAVIQAANPAREHDHNGQCIGCGLLGSVSHPADGYGVAREEPCAPVCGFRTGTISPAMILRAAARRLACFPRGYGADIRAALDVAAVALIRVTATRDAGADLAVEDLAESARHALGAHLDEVTGPGGLLGADLIDKYGALVPRQMVAATLYLAAARNDGATFPEIAREQLIGEAFRLLIDCRPNAEAVMLTWGPFSQLWEVDLRAVAGYGESYHPQHFTGPDTDAFTEAQDLIRRALKISEPPYLKKAHYDGSGVTHEIALADTTYGQSLQ